MECIDYDLIMICWEIPPGIAVWLRFCSILHEASIPTGSVSEVGVFSLSDFVDLLSFWQSKQKQNGWMLLKCAMVRLVKLQALSRKAAVSSNGHVAGGI